MKSVRLDAEAERQLRRAAQAAGVSESEFIREAIQRRAEDILGETLDARLSDVVGRVQSKGGRARRAHDRFQEMLAKEKRTRRS